MLLNTTTLKHKLKVLAGSQLTFKNSIQLVYLLHVLSVLCLLCWILWLAIFGDINPSSSSRAWQRFDFNVKYFFLCSSGGLFLAKLWYCTTIFDQEVNITNKFKWFVFLESVFNPFGICCSFYKLSQSKIFYLPNQILSLIPVDSIKSEQERISGEGYSNQKMFPEISDTTNLLDINCLSFCYHGNTKYDKPSHSMMKRVSPKFYAKHMCQKNNRECGDHEFCASIDFAVLKNINLSIKPNSFNTVIGCNGSGKTTLIKVINRLTQVYSGDILWVGKNSKDINIKSFAQNVSYIPQHSIFYGNISLYDFVAHGLYPNKRYWESLNAEDHEFIASKLKTLNIYHLKNRFINELSGGERQKAIIVRALVQNTKVIILDEPTSYLDIYSQHYVLDLFKQMQQENKLTIIAILHDIDQARQYSDNIILIDKGMVYKYGEPDRVLEGNNRTEIVNNLFCS